MAEPDIKPQNDNNNAAGGNSSSASDGSSSGGHGDSAAAKDLARAQAIALVQTLLSGNPSLAAAQQAIAVASAFGLSENDITIPSVSEGKDQQASLAAGSSATPTDPQTAKHNEQQQRQRATIERQQEELLTLKKSPAEEAVEREKAKREAADAAAKEYEFTVGTGNMTADGAQKVRLAAAESATIAKSEGHAPSFTLDMASHAGKQLLNAGVTYPLGNIELVGGQFGKQNQGQQQHIDTDGIGSVS